MSAELQALYIESEQIDFAILRGEISLSEGEARMMALLERVRALVGEKDLPVIAGDLRVMSFGPEDA